MPVLTPSGTIICTEHERIVHGGRGDYVEMAKEHILHDNISVPPRMEWRRSKRWLNRVFYIEHRTNDEDNVKVYEQLKTVDYADYRIGFWYVAVKSVRIEGGVTS